MPGLSQVAIEGRIGINMNQLPQPRFVINRNGVAPAAGGVDTFVDKPQLTLGAYSNTENVRQSGGGFEMRGGLTPHNQTAESSGIFNLYSYKSDLDGSLHFFAQLENGDLLTADDLPPTASGAADFGDVDMDMSAIKGDVSGTVVPGSFSKSDNALIHSNGGMQHVIWPGPSARPRQVFWKNSSATLDRILEGGVDLTNVLTDENDTSETATYTYTIANNDGLYVNCPYKANEFDIDMGTVVADGSTTLKVQYFDGDEFTDATTGTDGTSGLQQDGSITFTAGADEKPTYMFGTSGYWYRLYLSAGDATETVRFAEISYTGPWQLLTNVMDDFDQYVIEAQVEGSASEYRTYAASTVDLSTLASGDYLYFATTDNIWAARFDVGSNPNLTASTAITSVEGWTNAAGWAAVSGVEDSTNGLANTGWVSWEREDHDKMAFNGSNHHMYWWRIKWDDVMSATVVCAITTLGIYDIADFGVVGLVSTTWKDRGIYTFGKFPRDLYVSRLGRPNVLNGVDTAILSPGDGRRNRVVAAVSFHNELMVWQREEGSDGGCLTIFEGYSPSTFGRLILSTTIGTFSQKSVCVLDGSLITTRKDDFSQKISFFLSHYGIFMTDGRTVQRISDSIQNYFDPSYAECITRGQEDKMWIGVDSSKNCLRVGLVSGSGATECNVFPVYDLGSLEWGFDTFPTGVTGTGIYPQCYAKVEGNSGDVHSLQYLGCKFGRVYRSDNTVTYDKASSTAVYITAKTRAEFSNGGNLLDIRELVLRASANADYTLSKKIYENGVLDSSKSETFTMDDEYSGLTFRERILERAFESHHFSVELTWQDTEAEGDPAPVLYDYVYDIQSETNKA